jgi:hypothetical protein
MAMVRIQCPKCGTPVLEPAINQGDLVECNGCSSPLQVEVFPALFRQNVPGETGELVIVDGDSTCFYHLNKKAERPCQACGRFLCALCDCDFHGEHFCPACLEAGKTKGKIKNLQNQRPLYDTIALMLAVLPIVTVAFWFLSLVTAPAALITSIVYWNAPRSIIHRSKIRYVLAIVFSVIQIGGWVALFYFLFSIRRG